MKRALIAALALALLAPSGAVAQDDPQVVCTRVDMPEGHILADSEVLRGEPDDGHCDVVVYLPLVVGDSLLIGALTDAAEKAALDEADQSPGTGMCATYQVVATDDQPVTPEILEQTRSIIEHRVNATGVVEPIVATQGADRISVELPGVQDEADIRSFGSLIDTTGVLEFMPVPPELQGMVGEGPLPEGMVDIKPLFTGEQIASAAIAEDQDTREIVLDLQLKDTGAQLFDEYATEHYGEQFAIVLDGQVMTAPAIRAARFGGRAQISGSGGGFDSSEAQTLVTVLQYGSLPLAIREVDSGTCEGSVSS